MSYPIVSPDRQEQAHYERLMRRSGGNHEYAVRIAVGALFHGTCGLVTDNEFLAGHGTLAQQFDGAEDQLKDVLDGARARGFTPGIHDVYLSSIADDVGDPKAFVPPDGGRHHVKKVAEKHNLAVNGMVNHKPVMFDPANTSK